MAASQFGAVTRLAYELIVVVRAQDWNSANRLIALVASELGSAKGTWRDKLIASEIEDLQSLEYDVVRWHRLIPNPGDSSPNERQLRAILQQCNFAVNLIATISARLNRQFLQRNGEE
jgi:hypothetical protein